VVATSLALSTIFHGGSRVRSVDANQQEDGQGGDEGSGKRKDKGRSHGNKLAAGTADIPSLLPVFIDTFSAPSGVPEEQEVEVEEEVEVEVEAEVAEQQDEAVDGGDSASHSMTLLSSDNSVNAHEIVNDDDDGPTRSREADSSPEKTMPTTKKKIKKMIKVKRIKPAPAPSPAAPASPAAGRGGADAAIDWISKLDFLEFCQAVVDVKRYSVCIQ